MPNKEALKLPDPLLVRFYRDQKIDKITKVTIDDKTRDVTIALGKQKERFKYLADIGWIPAA
jgi:CTP:phosphocholine cytidylyltransferase-like protein